MSSIIVAPRILTNFKLPDSIQDSISNKSQKQNIVTHCRRELMHAVWGQILDKDFIASYRHGFVMHCLDGVWRRFYPRIFSYSADYPEKYGMTICSNVLG